MQMLDNKQILLAEIQELKEVFYLSDFVNNVYKHDITYKKKDKDSRKNLIVLCEKYLHYLKCEAKEIILKAESNNDISLLQGHSEEVFLYDRQNGLQIKQANLF